MADRWEVTLKGHDQLLVKMQDYSNQSEQVINDTLKKSGGEIATDKITNFIPVSAEQLRSGHRHAKSSKPLTVTYFNLGFRVRPKGNFDYLKYPDLGIGTSKKIKPQEFMRRGLEIALDPITDELMRAFDVLNK